MSSSSSSASSASSAAPADNRIILKSALTDLQKAADKAKDAYVAGCCRKVLDNLPRITNVREDAHMYMEPLIEGLKAAKPDVIGAALDGLHKLVSFGMLNGSLPSIEGRQNLAEDVVRRACEAVRAGKESVNMRLVKMLVACATSDGFPVHDAVLLDAFSTCYRLALASTSSETISAARAGVNQFVDSVFQALMAPDYVEYLDAEQHVMSPALRDGLHVLRALCKILAQEESSGRATNAVTMNKQLSLELIHRLLTSYPLVLTAPEFVTTMRKYLSMNLLQLMLSNSGTLFQTTLNVVLTLYQLYAVELRGTLLMFFETFAKKVLPARGGAAEKILVLRFLQSMLVDDAPLVGVVFGDVEDMEEEDRKDYEDMLPDFQGLVAELREIVADILSQCVTANTVPDGDALKSCIDTMEQIAEYFFAENKADESHGLSRSITQTLSAHPVNEDLSAV